MSLLRPCDVCGGPLAMLGVGAPGVRSELPLRWRGAYRWACGERCREELERRRDKALGVTPAAREPKRGAPDTAGLALFGGDNKPFSQGMEAKP